MSSWVVLATSAGVVTIAASALAIGTLAAAVRSQRRAASKLGEGARRQLVEHLAYHGLIGSRAADIRAADAIKRHLRAARDAREPELLSERMRTVARDLEAKADSITVGATFQEADKGDTDDTSGSCSAE
jgi:hypothetical protein